MHTYACHYFCSFSALGHARRPLVSLTHSRHSEPARRPLLFNVQTCVCHPVLYCTKSWSVHACHVHLWMISLSTLHGQCNEVFHPLPAQGWSPTIVLMTAAIVLSLCFGWFMMEQNHEARTTLSQLTEAFQDKQTEVGEDGLRWDPRIKHCLQNFPCTKCCTQNFPQIRHANTWQNKMLQRSLAESIHTETHTQFFPFRTQICTCFPLNTSSVLSHHSFTRHYLYAVTP